MSEADIKKAIGKLAYGVNVVTVGRGGVENGLTISWLSQVSFSPAMVMIAVDNKHYSVEFLDSTQNFTVNILGESQSAIAAHFAKPSMSDRGKLDDIATQQAPSGAAVLSEAVAYLDCEVTQRVVAGDHTLYIGTVTDGAVINDAPVMTSVNGMHYRKTGA
jgi:flavin reductase (DIM6/NTAB) family NADH-FMN oxidoreductase RutF